MSIQLQCFTVVVRRLDFMRCQPPPDWNHLLLPKGGFSGDTAWYDTHLWCETALDGQVAEDLLGAWEDRGLHRHSQDGSWQELCLAASGKGPLAPCPWLEFSEETNAVWLSGTEPGELIGGHPQRVALEAELARAEAAGEAAYDRLYDARRPKEAYEDACQALGRAQSLARFLNRQEQTERIEARLAHIKSVYNAQFRGW